MALASLLFYRLTSFHCSWLLVPVRFLSPTECHVINAFFYILRFLIFYGLSPKYDVEVLYLLSKLSWSKLKTNNFNSFLICMYNHLFVHGIVRGIVRKIILSFIFCKTVKT